MEDFRSPDDLFKEEFRKVKQVGKNYGGYIPFVVVGLLLLLLLQGAVYSVDTDAVGVIQRFGKYARISDPGIHLKIPFGIEQVTPVKIRRVYKEEFGFRTARSGVTTTYSPRQFPEEALILTGDLNILDVRWIVQYRISDPVAFLFNTRDPVNNVRDISEVVIRRLVGDYTVDEVLTVRREDVSAMAQESLQELMDRYETGITILTLMLLDVNPPDPVKPAFNEVNEARQQREQMINQAWEEYNRAVPRAEGEAQRTIRQAEGFRINRVNRAKGEASRFIRMWEEYSQAPEVTRKRLYLEAMAGIMPRAKAKYVVDPENTSILPLLRLGEDGGDVR